MPHGNPPEPPAIRVLMYYKWYVTLQAAAGFYRDGGYVRNPGWNPQRILTEAIMPQRFLFLREQAFFR